MGELSVDARKLANKQAGQLAFVSGIILLVAGVTGAASWSAIEAFVTENISENMAIQYTFVIFILVASFGGILVMLGGILFFEEKVRTAKLLIMLGVGMGLIGVIITLIVAISRTELASLTAVGLGFVGIVLSVIARLKAEKVEI